ncbi:MAG: hypothetical protein ACRDG6_09395 [Candidatus Limnocylindria bacterium]
MRAIVGVLLALPFATLFGSLLIGGEPPDFGPLEPLLVSPAEGPNVVGSAIVFGTWLLTLVAFTVNVDPIVRDARAGRGIATHPANLVVALGAGLLVALFVGGIIVDQYPCWIGVPNCD